MKTRQFQYSSQCSYVADVPVEIVQIQTI